MSALFSYNMLCFMLIFVLLAKKAVYPQESLLPVKSRLERVFRQMPTPTTGDRNWKLIPEVTSCFSLIDVL